MAQPPPKQAVAALINRWVERSGFQKQAIAARAGFASYDEFYNGYLNQSRILSTDPGAAIRVVRAFSERLPERERCTAAEAVAFFSYTQLPIDGFRQVMELNLFPPAEWRAAIEERLAVPLPAPGAPAGEAALLAQLAELLRERLAPPAPAALADVMPGDDRPPPAPAPIPVPHRMPLGRGRLFGGRDAELRALARLIRGQEIGATTALTGIGGVGKTSLASEFVHRYGQFFAGGAFWVSAADPQALAAQIAACGESGLIQHPGWADLPVDERAALVARAWQEPMPRLLVFDNCEDEETLVRWRPTSGGCRVLITSRRARWPSSLSVEALPLRELGLAEGLALLRRYRPDLRPDDASLAAIVAELGGLPLALHLAGSYLETCQDDPEHGSPARLLADLRAAAPLDHAALRGEEVARSLTGHELNVSRTFALSLGRLDPAEPREALARRLLARAAWLAPGAPFDAELLAATAGAGPAYQAIRPLVNLGLLGEDEGGLRIHRLVAHFARAELPDPAALDEVCSTLGAVAEQIYHARNFARARQLLPHGLHLDAAGGHGDEARIRLWNGLPFLLDLAGDMGGGLPYLERAHAELLRGETLETPLGGEVLNNLAEWRRALGDSEAALELHCQALAVRAALAPPDERALVESYANLGDTYREAGDYERAREMLERALELNLRIAGPEHETSELVHNQLALILYSQGRFAEARDSFGAILAQHEQRLGPDDVRVGTVRMNLAASLMQLGQTAEAVRLTELTVAAYRVSYGELHIDTLRTRLNLGRALMRDGRLARAAAELREIVGPLAAALGEEHPFAALARSTLAELEPQLGAPSA